MTAAKTVLKDGWDLLLLLEMTLTDFRLIWGDHDNSHNAFRFYEIISAHVSYTSHFIGCLRAKQEAQVRQTAKLAPESLLHASCSGPSHGLGALFSTIPGTNLTVEVREWRKDKQTEISDQVDWALGWRSHSTPEAQHIYYRVDQRSRIIADSWTKRQGLWYGVRSRRLV